MLGPVTFRHTTQAAWRGGGSAGQTGHANVTAGTWECSTRPTSHIRMSGGLPYGSGHKPGGSTQAPPRRAGGMPRIWSISAADMCSADWFAATMRLAVISTSSSSSVSSRRTSNGSTQPSPFPVDLPWEASLTHTRARARGNQHRRAGTSFNAREPRPLRPGLSHQIVRSERTNVLRLRALGTLRDVELDLLVLVEGLVALRLDGRVVNEDVIAAVLLGDEAEALLGVEPLNCALSHAGCSPCYLGGKSPLRQSPQGGDTPSRLASLEPQEETPLDHKPQPTLL